MKEWRVIRGGGGRRGGSGKAETLKGEKSGVSGGSRARQAEQPSCAANSCLTFRGDCQSSEMMLHQSRYNALGFH